MIETESNDGTNSSAPGIFRLGESEGYTNSERFLARLCRDSFLQLWSTPNAYRAPNKELIDNLLVFGNDVVLFSDKDIALAPTSNLEVTWPRWARRAIDDSARQLARAKHWVERFPEKVFLDCAATTPVPVSLPSAEVAKYHLVATARGASNACAVTLDAPYGSLIVDTTRPAGWIADRPFHVGPVRHKSGFIHVFDELTIELLLNELDTVVDFLGYLKAREAFLSGGRNIVAAGEEQLLAVYLTHKHLGVEFIPETAELSTANLLHFDESHADAFFNSEPYRAKKIADRHSYFWDRLIQNFIVIGNPAHLGEDNITPQDVELALRAMASESRFSRRTLVEGLRAFLANAVNGSPQKQHFRIVASNDWREKAYVFFTFPKVPGVDYEEYRIERKERLSIYCMCLLAKHPNLTAAVGIGFDHPLKDYEGGSEDLIMIPQTELSAAQRQRMNRVASELGILGNKLRTTHMRFDEYPSSPADLDEGQRDARANSAKKKRKNKRKQSNASRKANRR